MSPNYGASGYTDEHFEHMMKSGGEVSTDFHEEDRVRQFKPQSNFARLQSHH